MLLASNRSTADVSTTPPAAKPTEAWDAWKPEFSRYGVVIGNFKGGHTEKGVRWPRRVEKPLEE